MFFLVSTPLAVALERHLAIGVVDRALIDVGHSPRTVASFRDAIPAVTNVSALAEHLRAVGIGVFDEVVVKDLPVVDALADFTATHAAGAGRKVVHQPVADVQVVDVLFDDMGRRTAS